MLFLSSCEVTNNSIAKTSSQDLYVNNTETVETVETVEIVETVETVETVEIVEIVKSISRTQANQFSDVAEVTKFNTIKTPQSATDEVLINKIEEPKKSQQVAVKTKHLLEKNLWSYISNRYSISAANDLKINKQISWFQKNPGYLTRVTRRATPYLYLIVKEVEKSNLPIEIALLPIVESAYYPFAYSHGTASGLWQFIPSTAKLYGLKDNWWIDDRRDVVASTKAAISYLSNLNKLFKGDWLLAIAAYNSGPGRVQREIRKNIKNGKKTDFWHLDLPPETRSYVPKLLAVANIIKNPDSFNQKIVHIDNEQQVQSVLLSSQFDLALIAKWSELSLDEVYSLNPGLKRWATPSEENYSLLLPIDKVLKFQDNVARNPNKEKVSWLRYKIKPGDTLSALALKYRTTIKQIKEVNGLPNHNIRAGKYLIVPVAQKESRYYSLSEDQRKKQRIKDKKNAVKITHIVVEGDSLWEIARKYNVLIDSIVKWNQLSLTKPLRVGKELLIYKHKPTTQSNVLLANKVGIDIDRKVTYTVRQDDNLSLIAHKFDVSVEDLKLWNNIDIVKPIQPGQKLIVVVNVINSEMK